MPNIYGTYFSNYTDNDFIFSFTFQCRKTITESDFFIIIKDHYMRSCKGNIDVCLGS